MLPTANCMYTSGNAEKPMTSSSARTKWQRQLARNDDHQADGDWYRGGRDVHEHTICLRPRSRMARIAA